MIRKLLITITLIISLAASLTGCRQNDGYIGDLFGVWRLESLWADDDELPLYDNETLLYEWRFQTCIIFIQTVYPHEDYSIARGNWERTDGQLLLDFGHHENAGTGGYVPPAALHLIEGGITPLQIDRLSSKHMELHYVNEEDGVRYRYILRKAY